MPDAGAAAVRRILVPLDLNRLSEAKLPYAEAQARAFGADMILIHVIPNVAPSADTVTVEESQAHAYLDAISMRLRGDGVTVESVVRHGTVVDTILDEIATQRADLVVIGSNVRRGISRLLLGSVAEEIVARAPCPVLVIRPDPADAERTMPVRSFDDDVARTGPVAPKHLGIREVDVARIVGSVGRAAELDASFRIPGRQRLEEQRYKGILDAMTEGVSLPPITLYKLGYGYYVLDGNHRVAAARQLGIEWLEADVTEFLPLADPLVKRVFAERRAFERATGLTHIGIAQVGNYAHIDKMIRAFQREHPEFDLRDAAKLWEARVYRPLASQIRTLRLGELLPGHRTADIFVQMAILRDLLAEQAGEPVEWEEALRSLRAHLTTPRAPHDAGGTSSSDH